jgi:hypothetical protein
MIWWSFMQILFIFFLHSSRYSFVLGSNSNSTLSVHKKMRWLLKSPFDLNHHLINHMLNDDFKSHFIFWWTLNVYVELLCALLTVIIRALCSLNYKAYLFTGLCTFIMSLVPTSFVINISFQGPYVSTVSLMPASFVINQISHNSKMCKIPFIRIQLNKFVNMIL